MRKVITLFVMLAVSLPCVSEVRATIDWNDWVRSSIAVTDKMLEIKIRLSLVMLSCECGGGLKGPACSRCESILATAGVLDEIQREVDNIKKPIMDAHKQEVGE